MFKWSRDDWWYYYLVGIILNLSFLLEAFLFENFHWHVTDVINGVSLVQFWTLMGYPYRFDCDDWYTSRFLSVGSYRISMSYRITEVAYQFFVSSNRFLSSRSFYLYHVFNTDRFPYPITSPTLNLSPGDLKRAQFQILRWFKVLTPLNKWLSLNKTNRTICKRVFDTNIYGFLINKSIKK